MKRLLSYAVALLLVALPGHVQAQDNVAIQSGDQIKLLDVQNAVVASWGGVYLGPYTGQLVSDPTQPTFSMYCVDYAHSVSLGQTWTVNQSNLAGSDLSQTRLGNAGAGTYGQVAFLASLFDSWDVLATVAYDSQGHTFFDYYGTYVTDKREMWSAIHAAIWSLTSGGTLPNNPIAAGLAIPFLAYAQMQSATGFNGLNLAEWSILTPTNMGVASSPQEMLVRTTVTPEPETILLLGTGVLFLFALARRKKIREIGDI